MKRWLVAIIVLLTVAAFGQQFQHVVIVVQENRTPDNLFGSNPNFTPGVDIATSGQGLQGQTITFTPAPLANCYDLPHSHTAYLKDYAGGQNNGWDANKPHYGAGCVPGAHPAYSYVDNSKGKVQPYFDLATQYGFANRMFQTNQGASFPAHQFIVSGTSSITDTSLIFAAENQHANGLKEGCNAPPGAYVTTIDSNGNYGTTYPCFPRASLIDELQAAGLSWRYYAPGGQIQWNGPAALQSYYQSPYLINNPKKVLSDISNCKLPNVSWVMPTGQNSDHPATQGGGPAWVAGIVNAIGTSSCGYWNNTAILITWDDWGGWYDHVLPPQNLTGWCVTFCYGYRLPLIVVSAYTPAMVDNNQHDFGSILRFTEANFGLGLIGPGTYADSYADDLSAFFGGPQRPFVQIKAPKPQFLNAPLTPPDDD